MAQKTVYQRLSKTEWAEIGRYVEDHPEESLNSIAERFQIRPSTLRSRSQKQGWRTQKTTRTKNDAENITDEIVGENITHKFASENITDEIVGAKVKPDWPQIKAWYVTHPLASFRVTAKRYGVSESTLTKRAIAEGWAKERQTKRAEIEARAQQLAKKSIAAKVAEDRALEIVTTELLVNEARRVALEALREARGPQKMWAAFRAVIVAKVSQQAPAITLNKPGSQAGHIDLLSINQIAADHTDRENPTNSTERTLHLRVLDGTGHLKSPDHRAA